MIWWTKVYTIKNNVAGLVRAVCYKMGVMVILLFVGCGTPNDNMTKDDVQLPASKKENVEVSEVKSEESMNSESKDDSENEIQADDLLEYDKVALIKTSGSVPEDKEDATYIIQSAEQFSNIDAQFPRKNLQEILSNEFGELEADFYDKYVLIMGINVEGSSSYPCTFDSMTIHDKEISININCVVVSPSLDEEVAWFCFASVDKDKLSDWAEFNVVVNNTTTYEND